jgi:hypothetical protein
VVKHSEVKRMKKVLAVLVIAAAAVSLSGGSIAAPAQPVVLAFEKEAVSANAYVGTIEGGGTIDVLVLDRRSTDTALHFSALFRVDVGDKWFATVLRGSLEFATGQTHLRGKVTHGNWLQGAKVREAGQLVGTNPLAFTGTLTLTPKQEDDDD